MAISKLNENNSFLPQYSVNKENLKEKNIVIDPAKKAARQQELSAKIMEAMGSVDLSKQIEGPGHQLFDQYFQWSDFTQTY